MTEALLSQIIGVLLFVTVVVIVIIVIAQFSIKAGAKRKRESAERLRRIYEEEREGERETREEWKRQEREERETLRTLFSKIENQVSCEQTQEKSASGIVTLPNDRLFSAPGQNMQEFLQMITVELSRKRTEYLVVGLLNETNSPSYMLELKGRSVWVSYDAESILDKAAELDTVGVMLIHNHPTPSGFGPNLEASEEDISSGYSFYVKCKKRGFNFLGDFIVSKGCYEEFLIPLMKKAWDDVSDSTTEREEQTQKEEREKELQVAKNTPVFLLDEIPRSISVEFKTLQEKGCYEKLTFLRIAGYLGKDLKTIHGLIVQGKTPIVRRVGGEGQFLWLVRKRDFDAWIKKFRKI